MKTSCAFHQGHFITQFCKCLTCLLPLCSECLPLHKQEHSSSINQPTQIAPVELILSETRSSITSQFKHIDFIAIQTINKFRESEEQHKRLFQQIIHHKEMVMHSIQQIYDSMVMQLDLNFKKREIWLKEFNDSVFQLRQELGGLNLSLNGQKYLRTIIMWNKMKPFQIFQEISKKAEKKWVAPLFSGFSQEQVTGYLSGNLQLKVLEIQGDSGIKKILQSLRILRYGEEQGFQGSSQKALQIKNVKQSQQQKVKSISKSPSKNIVINTQGKFVNQPITAPIYFTSPSRKNSTKKIEVLSIYEFHKGSQINENTK